MGEEIELSAVNKHGEHEIAIIGIGCRFPGGANDPDSFWGNLVGRVDSVTEIPTDRWNTAAYYSPLSGSAGKTDSRWGGFVEDIDRFDPSFFGISPREASSMDPQQRLLLETAWESFEDAGFVPDTSGGSKTGVFVGISTHDYSQIQASFRDKGTIGSHTTTGGVMSIAANRISYLFNFQGPSLVVDTACSSSLVAVHLACRSLRDRECTTALVGGVNALLIPDIYVGFSRMSMLSPDGRCKAFDASGNGFVRGEGAGMILLKPLRDALRDGNRIYSVIRGSAVNQDGRTGSLTVPGEEAQRRLILEACADAGISPSEIDYVEAHGTGTPVGDPIEASAIGSALGRRVNRPCPIGSVKTNIGHLEAGSGIAGLIKASLCLHHGEIPPNLHFEQPNPGIDFVGLGIRVPVCTEKLPRPDAFAGVNSFGFGGTNAHVILQGKAEAPRMSPGEEPQTACLMVLSAPTPESLRDSAIQYRDWLAGTALPLPDIAGTLLSGRFHHRHRIAVAAESREEAAGKLSAYLDGDTRAGLVSGEVCNNRKVAFVFTGQGPQWWGMGRELMGSSAVFREKIEECDSLFRKWGVWSLIEELSRDEHSSRMDMTEIAQPAIFALQVGLAAWWREHGILPDALIGHSVGEAASAHLCGALDLPSAAEVIFHRGRTMQAVPPLGRMLAVALSTEEVRPWIAGLEGVIDLAAVNSPRSVTLSGEQGPLEKAAKRLEEAGVWCRFLKVHHAFHSSLMDPVEQGLRKALSGIVSGKPSSTIVSTVSGAVGRDALFDAGYWWCNVRQPVLFWQGISALAETGITDFLEIGPHPALSGSVLECLRELKITGSVIPSLRRGAPEEKTLLESLAALHVRGFPVRQGRGGKPVSLPRHQWRKERLWQESPESAATRLGTFPHPLLGRSVDAAFPLWNSHIDTALLSYLEDHQLNSRTVFPAAAYLEMALAAAMELHGKARVVLENVSFQRALFLPEKGRRLELSLDCDPEGGAFRITSRPGAEHSWTPHCTGVLRDDIGTRLPALLSAERIRHACSDEWTGADSYASFSSSGFHFGESFRRLGRISRRNGEALGEITPFPGLDTGSYVLHPALLDACFQVILSAMDPAQCRGRLFLPSTVESVRFFAPATERLWSHAVLTSASERSVTADISVHDDHGNPVLQLQGFHCVSVDGPNAGDSENADCFYRTEWREAELSADAVREPKVSWVVCGGKSSPARRIAGSLSALGEQCRTAISRDLASALGAGSIHHVVWIPSPGTQGADDALGLCAELLSLVRTLAIPDRTVRFTIITRGAQPVVGRETSPSMGALVGLARVVMNEHPALRCRVIDMDGDEDSWDQEALLRELTLGAEEEAALRGIHRFLPRIVRFAPKPALRKGRDLPFRLESDRPGVLEHLSFLSTVRRPPGDGEIEVEVRAAGLNFRDVMKALGIYPVEDDLDLLLGDECSGRVVALGRGVTHLNEGDEVLLLAPGSFSRYLTVNSALAFRKPSFLSMEEAATIPVAFLTAKYALEQLARVSPGEKVLIHAAAGGVGLAALQVALRAGAEVFATAGTDKKRALVSRMGATHVMDSRTLEFAEDVMRITGDRGVDVVLNSLSGAAIGKGLSVLAPYGRFLEIGKRDIYRNSRIGLQPFSRSLSYHSIDLSRLMKDRPEFVAGMLGKLTEEFEKGELSPLPVTTWPLEMAVEAFREMAQGKHHGKIAFSFPEEGVSASPREDEVLRFRSDATYLITGGVGGFGMAIAEWMIGKGAAHLVLLGAGGNSTDAARKHFSDSGVDVLAETVDVSDKKALGKLFSRIGKSMPPLCGVIHCAVKWEDAVLQKLTESQLSTALKAKAEGAWNLHEALSDTPLDFFVMISSVSALVGNPGQGAYSAANAYLDALAHHRKWKGLPALTINWGHLGEVGYAARHEKVSDHLDRHGFTPIPISRALAMLERLMLSGAVQPAAMIVDWERWAESNPRLRKVCRYRDVIAPDTSAARTGGNSLADAIGSASGAEKAVLLEEFTREVCARVLGVSPSNLDPNRPLHEMGLDSLMGIELINRIEAGLKIQFPAGRITGSPTIGMIVSILEDCLSEKGKNPHT